MGIQQSFDNFRFLVGRQYGFYPHFFFRINFRASSSIRPQVAATRAEDRMDFVDLESQLKAAGSGSGSGEGGGNEGGDGGLDENPLG